MTEMIDSNHDGTVDQVRFDANGDGYNDASAWDQDQNGRYESMGFDTDRAGDSELVAYDDNQDGIFERVTADQDNNGQHEVNAFDTNHDGVHDTVKIDANVNGMDDREEAAADMIIGPVTNRDPISQLILDLVEETGQPVFGTPDTDHDGWDDNEDARIYDPFYR